MKNIIAIWKKFPYRKNKNLAFACVITAAAALIALTIFEYASCESEELLFCLIIELVITIFSVVMTISMLKTGFVLSLLINVARAGYATCETVSGGQSSDNMYRLVFSVTVIAVISLVYILLLGINQGLSPVLKENSERGRLVKEAERASKKIEEKSQIIIKNEKELYNLAFYDQLTSLANRTKIKNEINALIEKKIPFSVIFIGLDNFKAINESRGHEAGDKLLAEVSDRILSAANKNDICGRLGGDEFIIISTSHYTDADCKNYVDEIYGSFADCFNIDEGTGIYVNASFGTASYPKDGSTCSKLLKGADIALNKAKNEGKNRYVLFDRNMQIEIDYHNKIVTHMHSALQNNEFYLVYQPQFYPNKKLRGFEALIRWDSPLLGNISPVSFIPIAEEINFITTLGEWIINTACKKLAEISKICDSDIIMSVNVSSKQFSEELFINTVSKALIESGADSSRLELEVTETLLLNSIDDTALMLEQLKRMKIKTSIDDFGTGYSSLSYLRKLPIDTLKIDKSFIDVISTDASGKSIVDTIIQLAHTLGMTVIAEGVEYTEQLDYLKSRSCDCIQGFLFSRPLDSEDVSALVAEYGNAKAS